MGRWWNSSWPISNPKDDTAEVLHSICQYVNQELPDIQTGFRKSRGTRDQIANIPWIIEKAREFQENIYFCFIDYAKSFDCVNEVKVTQSCTTLCHPMNYIVHGILQARILEWVAGPFSRESSQTQVSNITGGFFTRWITTVWITTNCGKSLKRWEYQTKLLPLRNLYAGQEATVRTEHGTMDWFQIGKGVHQGHILSPRLFNLYAQGWCHLHIWGYWYFSWQSLLQLVIIQPSISH